MRVQRFLRRAFRAYAERPCLGIRQQDGGGWAWLTYGDCFKLMRRVGDVLRGLGIPPGAYVGMSSDNSPAYFVVYLALLAGGWRAVPLSLIHI